jgi:hypothetical protein
MRDSGKKYEENLSHTERLETWFGVIRPYLASNIRRGIAWDVGENDITGGRVS